MNKYQKDQLVKEAQKQAPIIIKKNFKGIHSVAVDKDNYKFYPEDLGGLSITGHINNDRDLFFHIVLNMKVIK